MIHHFLHIIFTPYTKLSAKNLYATLNAFDDHRVQQATSLEQLANSASSAATSDEREFV
jgi:hypothetical protein